MRRAFSLVELLVVIGIIAVLISILMPALTKARESANTLTCATQLRQIGQAIYAYASANGGLLPAWSSQHYYPDDTANVDDPNGPGWIVLLEPYIGVKPDNRLFHCPAFPVNDKSVTYFLEAHWMGVQSPPVHTMPITQIKLSSCYILCGEVTRPFWYLPPWGTSNDERDDIDKDDATYQCLTFFGEKDVDVGYNMHRAGNNILFVDGHVQAFKEFDPQAITYSPTELKNWGDLSP